MYFQNKNDSYVVKKRNYLYFVLFLKQLSCHFYHNYKYNLEKTLSKKVKERSGHTRHTYNLIEPWTGKLTGDCCRQKDRKTNRRMLKIEEQDNKQETVEDRGTGKQTGDC